MAALGDSPGAFAAALLPFITRDEGVKLGESTLKRFLILMPSQLLTRQRNQGCTLLRIVERHLRLNRIMVEGTTSKSVNQPFKLSTFMLRRCRYLYLRSDNGRRL